MKASVILAVTLAFAGTAPADVNYNLAIGQAKRAVNQTEAASQGGTAPTQPSAPAAPPAQSAQPAPPANPELAATLQNIADLRTDLDTLAQAADAQAGEDQRAPLMTHLSAAAGHDKKAAPESVKKLAGHLIAAVGGKKKLAAQNASLARDVHALFNGGHLSATQQQALLDGAKKILTDAGVPPDAADNVVADLKQIAAETR
jgi:hypothetical protein